MSDQYVWLIGGSVMAEPMAREILRRDYKLLITDQDIRCHCRRLATEFHRVSVYDVAANLELAAMIKDHKSYEIAAVLTIGTDAGPTVSALSDFFGLPGIGRDKAETVKNKIKMRESLGLAEPYYYIHRATDGGIGYFSPSTFPLAIKAPNLAGSRGFEIATSNAEVRGIVESRPTEDLLIERLLIGEDLIPEWRDKYGFDTSEAAFDFFIEDGELHYANGALRMFWVDRPGIEAGHLNPFEAIGSVQDMSDIMAIADKAAKALGLDWGVLKIDTKKDKRFGWCLLECATRLSGGFDHMHTSPLATGRDVTGAMLDMALGQPLDTGKLLRVKSDIACCYAPIYQPGRVYGMSDNTDEDVTVFSMVRGRIFELTINQNRPLFLITSGLNRDNVMARAERNSHQVHWIGRQDLGAGDDE